MAERFIGQGVTVEYSSDGGTTKKAVSQIQNITMPGPITEPVDVTVVTDSVMQYVSSRQRDYEDFAAQYLWDPNDADQNDMDTLLASGDVVDWYVTLPAVQSGGDATEIKFQGFITGLGGADLAAADPLQRNLTVKVLSDFTITSPPPVGP